MVLLAKPNDQPSYRYDSGKDRNVLDLDHTENLANSAVWASPAHPTIARRLDSSQMWQAGREGDRNDIDAMHNRARGSVLLGPTECSSRIHRENALTSETNCAILMIA